eukprot:CAMPEP_0185021664 /NCGR_PEP_ID=MMETSP1103-20130426/4367_1 /TAXON_ID=36769 /ORGANISM="Paraphysomonas bandaiensis, Strain Caron Lab Isolate" /LENGTH=380 /DNA_ID=CAMNT_0027553335 /DNA_START=256 /DNA_END=1398 /DNA_ORIENTATION=+
MNLKSGEYINFIDMKRTQPSRGDGGRERDKTLLLLHGFGSGLGMFFANYDALIGEFDRVIAVDWLGMGGSSRPNCRYSPRMPLMGSWWPSEPMGPTRATDFFIDSLEEFRESIGVSDFVLAGHSLGGYLCARYAMKYPHTGVNSLVLVSPAGLADIPPAHTHVPSSELPSTIRLIDCLWSSNFTPQQIVRTLGPKGPATVLSAVRRRFGSDRWNAEDTTLISDYLYHISAAPASGEYAMNSLLKPIISQDEPLSADVATMDRVGSQVEARRRTGVYAREPITPHVLLSAFNHIPRSENSNSDHKTGSSSTKPIQGVPPILLIYGDHDWLRFPNVDRYVNDLKTAGVDITLTTVNSAGHHLYLDNAPEFHSKMFSWLRERL